MKVDSTTKLEVSEFEISILCHALDLLSRDDAATPKARVTAKILLKQLIPA